MPFRSGRRGIDAQHALHSVAARSNRTAHVNSLRPSSVIHSATKSPALNGKPPMSGPKTGHISPSPSALFRRQCTALENWLIRHEEIPAADEIEAELKAARREAKALRESPTPPGAALLDAADRHREQLSLHVNQRRAHWAAAEAAITRLQAELEVAKQRVASAGTSLNWEDETRAIGSAGSAAQKAVQGVQQDRRQIDVLKRELTLVREKLTRSAADRTTANAPKQTAPNKAVPQLQELDLNEIRRAAITADVEKRLTSLAATLQADETETKNWLTDPGKWIEYGKLLEQTRHYLRAASAEEAERSIAAAEGARGTLRQEAAKNREATARNEEVAEAIMQALCDRNYNTPNYGELKSGDPLGGIQIRADVPNRDGKGNLRIDIHLDGRTVFEVENVPEGEEAICKDAVGGVGDAIADKGLVLEMRNWGRATTAKSESLSILPQQSTQRVREREGNRGP